MKSKKLSYVFALCSSAMLLAACASPTEASSSETGTSAAPKVSVTMSVCYEGGHATDMKFHSDNTKGIRLPYSDPSGNIYEDGDLKPGWKNLQKKLNFTIDDVTPNDKLATNYSKQKTAGWVSNGKTINIAQGNTVDIVKDGTGENGNFVDLSKHLDDMPNFNAFLEANPIVKKTISNASGEIYYTPYFDGFDDVSRMLMLRTDYVEKLLDGDTLPEGLDADHKLGTSYYTGYMPATLDKDIVVAADETKATSELTTVKKKYTTSLVAKFNSLSEVNGRTAVQTLRDWIDATYDNAYGTSRSKLFLGSKAVYDVDELVMLYRCVKLNSKFLLGAETYAAHNADIVPLYPRAARNDRVADLWRFMAFFGVRGTDGINGFYYVGEDGRMQDARGEAAIVPALKHMHEMYQEGLILDDFTNISKGTGSDGDFRSKMITQERGFSTYDYMQTTTILQDSIDGFTGTWGCVLPAVIEYGQGDDKAWGHYTESWRTVKPNSWFITKKTEETPAVLAKCLQIFDYMYSTEGNRSMSYGPDAYISQDEEGNFETIDYMGKQVPKLSDGTLAQITTLTGGNYTNYYRYYVGATFPVGYMKEQGMEYQTVSAKAKPSLNMYENSIACGAVKHVNHLDNNTDHWYDIPPASLPFTEQENTAMAGAEYKKLDETFSIGSSGSNVWSTIVQKGFGSGEDYGGFDLTEENYLTTVKDTLKLDSYLSLTNDAYDRFKSFQ